MSKFKDFWKAQSSWTCEECGKDKPASQKPVNGICAECSQNASKSVDIADAGPIPNSLLAQQDLECETCKSIDITKARYQIEERMISTGLFGARAKSKVYVVKDTQTGHSWHFNTEFEATTYIAREKYNNRVSKGEVEQTGKKLDKMPEKAEEAENIQTSISKQKKKLQLIYKKAHH